MGLLDGLIASLPDAKGSTSSAKSSSAGGGEIESLLRNKAAEYDIDPDLFVSLAKRESGLRPDAKNTGSSAGGLFQFIDWTWNRYGNKKDKFDPEANADAAARMLRDHLGMFDGDYSKALAAHHVGASKAASALTDRRIGDKDVSTQQWLSDIFTGAGRDNPMAKPRGAFADAEAGVGGYDQIRRGQIAQAASDDSPVSTSLKRGMKGLTHSAGLAIDNMLGDSEGAAQRIIDKRAFDQATPAPSSVQKFGRDWDELAEDDYAGMFGTILKNPAGSFNMMLEQTPNSLPGMAFQTVAGVAGRGLMAFGPVGAAAGLAMQSAAAFAGNFLPEGGAFLEDELHKSGVDTNDVRAMAKWIEEHRGENFKGGATKAGVISAVDGVTGWMGMKMLAGPSVRFAKAEKDFFTKNGVNVADAAALQAARASDAYKTALQPFAADLVKASEGFGMLKRGVGATALDAMGEGVGEYAGSYAATGDASIKDAVLEGVMNVGQGAAMAGAQYGIGKMSGPDQAMEELRKLATANIAPAEAKPNSPLSNAAQAAQAADPITEALKPISERFADRALYEQIRNHPNLGPDAMTQILSAYRVATNSNMDPMARQAAVDRLGEFFRLFDNQPNFTAGRADSPGVPAVVGNKPSAVGPVDPRVGAIDGEASRVAPNQQQGVVNQSAPALATDERARKAAEAEYEAAYQDLVKAEQLVGSDQELMQRQIAMRNAENRLQEINEAIEANRAKETAEKRGALLDRVLASNPGNPNRAFDRALRLEGFRDATFTKEEKEKIARFNELRSIQEDGVFSAPNEAGAFGIREKRPSAVAGRYQHIADMLSSGWQLVNKHQLTGPNGEVYNLKGAGEAQFVRNKLNQKAGNGNQSPRGGSQDGTDQGDFGVGGAGANGPLPQGGGNGSGQANALPDTRPADGAVSEAEATGAGSQPNNPLGTKVTDPENKQRLMLNLSGEAVETQAIHDIEYGELPGRIFFTRVREDGLFNVVDEHSGHSVFSNSPTELDAINGLRAFINKAGADVVRAKLEEQPKLQSYTKQEPLPSRNITLHPEDVINKPEAKREDGGALISVRDLLSGVKRDSDGTTFMLSLPKQSGVPSGESAPSPVDTSMRDMGAKAFADGLPRVAPEGIKGADKVRWLTGYDDAQKASASSQQKTDTSQEPKAIDTKSESDWLGELFGSDSSRMQPVEQNKNKKVDLSGLVGKLREFSDKKLAEANDWASRQYKQNKTKVSFEGDGPTRNESMSISAANESRRNRNVDSLQHQAQMASNLANRIERGFDVQEEIEQAIRNAESDIKRDGKARFGGTRESQIEAYISNSMLGDASYGFGEGTLPSLIRKAYEQSQQKTDEAPKAAEQAAPVSQPENDKPAYADDAELQDALSHLGDVLGDVFGAKLNITGKQYGASDLLPAMSKVIELLIKKGFKSFRESVGAATNAMRGNANTKGFVDQITPRQWKAAYNSVAEFHEGTDSEEDVAKYSAEQIQKIIALPEKIKEAEQATNHDATPGQKESGNYAKGKFAWHGLNIAVETAKGEDRTDKETNGDKWRVTMPATYGYVLGSEGADGDHVDVFMGDKPESQRVYVVNQTKPGSTEFDEHKIMLGYESEGAAIGDYLLSFSDTFGASVLGSVSGPYAIDDFKHMLESNRFSRAKPISDRLAYVNPRVEEKPVEQQPPGVKTNGTKEKAAAERLAQLLDKMDQVRMDRNTPEGSAKGIIRSAIEELRKERSVGNIPGSLDTAAQRLFRQYSAFSDVVSEVAESLRATDKYAETVAAHKAKQAERNTPTLDKITVTRSASLDGKAVEFDQQADEALKEIDSNMDLAKRLLECLAA